MKIFLSHSSADKKLASEIKKTFQLTYGSEVFLAHTDIKPLREWEIVILQELERCDVLFAILTEDFAKSDWTDQETGFVVARKILIIPLMINCAPYGFLQRYQGFKFDTTKKIEVNCRKLARLIVEDHRVQTDLLDDVIKVFKDTWDFKAAQEKSNILMLFEKHYSLPQIHEIIRTSIENSQIRGSWYAIPNIRQLISNRRQEIDSALIKAFEDAIAKK